jgi:hypothetical protein
MPSRSAVADLVAKIKSREQLYRCALRGDLALMRREHGPKLVAEALSRLGAKTDNGGGNEWDQIEHARRVRKGIARLMAERRARALDLNGD